MSYTIVDQNGLSSTAQAVSVTLDPGLSYAPSASSTVEPGQSTVIAVLTPGLAGDTLTLTAMNKAAAAGLSIGPVLANGTEQLIYTPPAGVNATGVKTLAYTIEDQHVGGHSYVAAVQVNGGPVVTPIVPTGNLENGQAVVIGTVAPGLAGDTLSITQGSGLLGVVSLGAADANGVQQVIYTAPPHIHLNSIENIAYSITDQHGSVAATGSANVQLDFGVTVTSAGAVILSPGQSAVVDTIVGGLPGDVVAFTKQQGTFGNFTLVQTVFGSATTANQYNVVYTETGAVAVSQRDYATFQVGDRSGGKLAGDGPVIRLEVGPRFLSSAANVNAAPGQTVAIGVTTVGLTGDVLTISGGANVPGTFSLGPVTGSGQQTIFYTAPASVTTNGAVALRYTIADNQGHSITGASSAFLANPPPVIVAPVLGPIEKGQSEIIAIVTPNAAADTLTLAQNAGGTGTVSLATVNGVIEVVYTAASAIAASGYDHVAYTLTDEHGGSVTRSATITLDGGPVLALTTPGVVVKGQSTVIGRVIPGVAHDTFSLTQTGTAQGVVTLSGDKIIYTAAAGVTTTGNDTVSYTVSDQHNDATVSSTATVKVLGAAPTSGDVAITSTTLGAFFDVVGDSPRMTFKGAHSTVLLEGSSSPTITDSSSYLTVAVGSAAASAIIKGFATDGHGVIDLLYGVGGYTTAAAVVNALKADETGGSIFSLGGGTIDIVGVPPASLATTHFRIG